MTATTLRPGKARPRSRPVVQPLEWRLLFAAAPAVSGVTLVNASSAAAIGTLSEGVTLDLNSLTMLFSARADVSSGTRSVRFTLDGTQVRVESAAPFAINGDYNGKPYEPWKPAAGDHVLQITPYSGLKASGTAGAASSIRFRVVGAGQAPPPAPPPSIPPPTPPPAALAVTGLTLYNTDTHAPLGELTDGAALDLAAVGARLSVVAAVNTTRPASVVFKIDGTVFHTESFAMYAINGGDTPADLSPWTPAAGGHVLTVTPFSGPSGTGLKGVERVVSFTVTGTPPSPTPGFSSIVWKSAKASPVVRAEAIGAEVNGKLYVLGGFNNEGNPLTGIPLQSRCDVYDPATNTWSRLADMPDKFSHAEGVVVGTDIWFVGGYVGAHPGPGTTRVTVYDTLTDTWAAAPELPVQRGAGAAALVGRSIYYTGGMDVTRTIDQAETFALDLDDPAAGWVRKPDLPNGRNHVGAASLGGKFYVVGGQHGQEFAEISLDDFDVYDPATNAWTSLPPLPAKLSHISEDVIAYQGRIIVIGGQLKPNTPTRTVYAYDPAVNKWTQVGTLPVARSTSITGFVNGQIVLTTGNGPAATDGTWVGTLK